MTASVSRLWSYPVKSMQGEEVAEILVGPGGVAGDRAYGFLDVESQKLVSAKRPKRFGALLDCRARFLDAPTLDAPTAPIEVTFPDGTVVRDDEAMLAQRVGQLLGREVRLITTAPDGLAFDELWPQLEGLGPEAFADAMEIEPADSEGDRMLAFPVALAAPGTMLDLAALHVLSTGTLATLAAAHPDGNWDPRRMRPNLLIDHGDQSADEDDWLGCDLHVGDEVVIHVVGPTPRCVMTTLAQPGLPRDPDVLKTIARVGLKETDGVGQFACAGSYAEVVTPGVVRRGDPVRFERVEPRKGALAAVTEMMAAALSPGT
jgi:uncharacterized protein